MVKRLVRGIVILVALVYLAGQLWPDLLDRVPARFEPLAIGVMVLGVLLDVALLSSSRARALWRDDDDSR